MKIKMLNDHYSYNCIEMDTSILLTNPVNVYLWKYDRRCWSNTVQKDRDGTKYNMKCRTTLSYYASMFSHKSSWYRLWPSSLLYVKTSISSSSHNIWIQQTAFRYWVQLRFSMNEFPAKFILFWFGLGHPSIKGRAMPVTICTASLSSSPAYMTASRQWILYHLRMNLEHQLFSSNFWCWDKVLNWAYWRERLNEFWRHFSYIQSVWIPLPDGSTSWMNSMWDSPLLWLGSFLWVSIHIKLMKPQVKMLFNNSSRQAACFRQVLELRLITVTLLEQLRAHVAENVGESRLQISPHSLCYLNESIGCG